MSYKNVLKQAHISTNPSKSWKQLCVCVCVCVCVCL